MFNVIETKTILIDKLEQHDQKGELFQANPEDTAFIQFSSGSTSEPKGVVLTHRNIMTNLNAIAIGANYSKNDIR